MAYTNVYITSGTTWTVPSDWNDADNIIQAIGPGGVGSAILSSTQWGGGGGAYVRINNTYILRGSVLPISVGIGGTYSAYSTGFAGGSVDNEGTITYYPGGTYGGGGGSGQIGAQGIIVVTYLSTTTGQWQIVGLTSGTTWTVPTDWNSSSNTIEAIGGGGGNGGGGGAYVKSSNITLTASASIPISIGAGVIGNGGATTFNTTTLVAAGGTAGSGGAGGQASASTGTIKYSGSSALLNGGDAGSPSGYGGYPLGIVDATATTFNTSTLIAAAGASGFVGGNAGFANASVGTVKFSGGSGSVSLNTGLLGGGGGGGAAGPSGVGNNGGASDGVNGPSAGGSGAAGAGGAGGGAGNNSTAGGVGGAGTNIGNVGSGGGGGGGDSTVAGKFSSNGGAGGLYGGGGGAGLKGGLGANGVIIISYTATANAQVSLNTNFLSMMI